MPAAPDLVATAARTVGLDEGLVARYWRTLREGGLVTVGRPGRGGHHAAVTARDATTLLLSLTATDSAAQAINAIEPLLDLKGTTLRTDGWLPAAEAMFAGRTIIDGLTALVSQAHDPDVASWPMSLRCTAPGPLAEVLTPFADESQAANPMMLRIAFGTPGVVLRPSASLIRRTYVGEISFTAFVLIGRALF